MPAVARAGAKCVFEGKRSCAQKEPDVPDALPLDGSETAPRATETRDIMGHGGQSVAPSDTCQSQALPAFQVKLVAFILLHPPTQKSGSFQLIHLSD